MREPDLFGCLPNRQIAGESTPRQQLVGDDDDDGDDDGCDDGNDDDDDDDDEAETGGDDERDGYWKLGPGLEKSTRRKLDIARGILRTFQDVQTKRCTAFVQSHCRAEQSNWRDAVRRDFGRLRVLWGISAQRLRDATVKRGLPDPPILQKLW